MESIIMYVCLSLLLASAGVVICMFVRSTNVYSCGNETECLEAEVDKILYLLKELKVVDRLKYEKSCKEALMTDLHDLFFFDELKDRELYLQRLRQKADIRSASENEEDQAIGRMYRKIVEDIRL